MLIEQKIFWKEDFKGSAQGGIFFRSFDLNKFLQSVEEEKGEVVGLRFEDNNVEIIIKDTTDQITEVLEEKGGEDAWDVIPYSVDDDLPF